MTTVYRLMASLSLTIGLTIPSYAQAQESIRLAYGRDYAPYSWLEQGEVKGLQIDILTELFERRLDIKTIHTAYPWKRAQWQVQLGLDDAMMTSMTSERSDYTVAATEILIPVHYYVYTYAGHPQLQEMLSLTNPEDLKKYHLVEYLGGSVDEFNGEDVQVSIVPELPAALKFLAQRRADIFIENRQIAQVNIKKLQLESRIVQTPFILGIGHRQLLISKKSPFINKLPEINQAIKAMKADGTLERIYQQYQ